MGLGRHLAPPIDYGANYFQEYIKRDDTPMGAALTRERCAFVARHLSKGNALVDIGIGGGRFVREYGCEGYDINPLAVDWLKARRCFCDVYDDTANIDSIAFWDSMEHIEAPEELVNKANNFVFVSMPIYTDGLHCINSRHFKPGEHLWYFTRDGLIKWFEKRGFELREHNSNESVLGRDGIESFAFKRMRYAI